MGLTNNNALTKKCLYRAANEEIVNKAARWCKEGESKYKNGDFKCAIECYSKVADACPYYLRDIHEVKRRRFYIQV